jgi:cardiolipin synthase
MAACAGYVDPVRVWTIPNVVTFWRLLAVPLFAVLHALGNVRAALWVFVAAGVSDGIDGLLARLLNQRSRLGALLDPIADKLLVTTALAALTFTGQVPGWFFVLVFLRELMMTGGALWIWMHALSVPASPGHFGKYGVFFMLATVLLGLISRLPEREMAVRPWLAVATILAAECVLVSAAQYAWRGIDRPIGR